MKLNPPRYFNSPREPASLREERRVRYPRIAATAGVVSLVIFLVWLSLL